MTNKIANGDYVLNNGELEQIEYIDELHQNATLILHAGRGCFYPDKNFGSRIKSAGDELTAELALLYARQALDTLDGVYVKSADLNNNQLIFVLEINNEERQVTVELENNI